MIAEQTTEVDTQSQLAQFAECVFEPTDIVEIRFLPSGRSIWCVASEVRDKAAELQQANQAGEHIHVGANPRKTSGGKCDSDVALARCMFADFDDTTIDAVRFRLSETSLPAPTMTIASGHGVHVYFRLEEPMTELGAWSKWQKDLAALVLSDGSVCNASRLMRLPGFTNWKTPTGLCGIIEARPDRVYELVDFHEIIRERQPVGTESTNGGCNGADNEGAAIVDYPRSILKARAYAATWEGVSEGMRNATAIKLAACLRRDFALSENGALSIMQGWNARNDPPLGEDELRRCSVNGAKYGKRPVGSKVESQTSIPAWQPFPVEVLPKKVQNIVLEAAKAMSVDPALVAVPLLVVFATAIGNSRRLRLKHSWFECAVLWAALVVPSGDLKTPALRLAADILFRRYKRAREEYREAVLRYNAEVLAYKADKEKNGDNATTRMPDKPTLARCVCSDITVEALACILEENWRGTSINCDELAGWFNSFDRYRPHGKGGDVAAWLSMHSAQPLIVDRKGASKAERQQLFVPRAAVSIVGSIQPRTLKRIVNPQFLETGLFARYLFAVPPVLKRRWTTADISESVEDTLDGIADRLFELQPDYDNANQPKPRIIRPNDEAHRLWTKFYDEHAEERENLGDDLRAAWSKKEAYAARLALVLHLTRLACGEAVEEGLVDGKSMAAGITLVRWFTNEDRRVYATLSQGTENQQQAGLMEYIKSHSGRITPRDLQQNLQAYRQPGGAEKAELALCELVRIGVGKWETTGKPSGGPIPRTFVLSGDNGLLVFHGENT